MALADWSRSRRLAALAAMVLAGVPAAVAQAAKSSFMADVDFSVLRTYQWVKTQPHPRPEVDHEIQRAIDAQLAAKGLTRVTESADLSVDYRVATTVQEQWPAFRFEKSQASGSKPVVIHPGTLGIELQAAVLKQVVWSGFVSKALDVKSSGTPSRKSLEKAAEALLRDYPPNGYRH